MTSALGEIRAFQDQADARLIDVRRALASAAAMASELPDLERRISEMRQESPYRSEDVEEKRARLEMARAAGKERHRLRLEEASLLREIEHLRRQLEQNGVRKFSLPLLERVEVAAPCDVSWASMVGDGDVRFCGSCSKSVFNLSMMTRDDAEALLQTHEGRALCIRIFRRDDGTVLTSDCPVGLRKQKFWRRTKGIAAAGIIAAGIGMMAMHFLASKCVIESSGATAGAMATMPP